MSAKTLSVENLSREIIKICVYGYQTFGLLRLVELLESVFDVEKLEFSSLLLPTVLLPSIRGIGSMEGLNTRCHPSELYSTSLR